MTPRRTFYLGVACLTVGWITAGWLEGADTPVVIDAITFAVLVVVIALTADRIGKP
jgi:hypothetical protein